MRCDLRYSWCSLQHARIQKIYPGEIQGIFKFPGGTKTYFWKFYYVNLRNFEFSNGSNGPDLDPWDPPLDSCMCRLIKMTAYPLLHEPFERGGGGGINVSIRLCFNTCIAFKNHMFNMKCSICLIWNVSKDNKERKLQFDYKDYKLHWNILASFIPLCLHAMNINLVNDKKSDLNYFNIT